MKIIGNMQLLLANNTDDNYLKQIHLFLNQMYYLLFYCDDETKIPNDATMRKFKHVENSWMNHEKQECLSKYNFNQEIKDISTVSAALKKHPAYNHNIFDYFSLEASKEDIKQFIQNEAILNLEFFDYLAFSIIGAGDNAKSEIIQNLWDEAGRGNVQQFHTTMFSQLMQNLGLIYNRDMIAANMSWEALAGINLFSHLALYPFNKIKYYGLLAATEILDPPHYKKLLQGFTRNFSATEINTSYYVEHEIIDREHAQSWLQKIVLPVLNQHPEKTPDFWLGFYLRLDSVQRYYDSLLQLFLAKQAA